MKRAYKSKTQNKVTPIVETSTKAAPENEVAFIMVAKGVLGFRESAHIVKIAEKTGCSISIASGKKHSLAGQSDNHGRQKSRPQHQRRAQRRGLPRNFKSYRRRDRLEQLILLAILNSHSS